MTMINTNYEWNINDTAILQKLKTGEQYTVRSDFFRIGSLKWNLQLCANGYAGSSMNESDLFLTLASLPPNTSRIATRAELTVDGIKYPRYLMLNYTQQSASWGWTEIFETNRDDMKECDNIKLSVDICIIDIFDKLDNNITDLFVDTELNKYRNGTDSVYAETLDFEMKIYEYLWNINDDAVIEEIMKCPNGKHFDSPIFRLKGLKWFIKIFPNGDEIDDLGNFDACLHLISLPKEIIRINIWYKITILELNHGSGFSKTNVAKLSPQQMQWWHVDMFKYQDIINADLTVNNQLNIKLEIAVLDAFDVNNISLYNDFDDEKKEIEVEVEVELPTLTRMYEWKLEKDWISLDFGVLFRYSAICE